MVQKRIRKVSAKHAKMRGAVKKPSLPRDLQKIDRVIGRVLIELSKE